MYDDGYGHLVFLILQSELSLSEPVGGVNVSLILVRNWSLEGLYAKWIFSFSYIQTYFVTLK